VFSAISLAMIRKPEAQPASRPQKSGILREVSEGLRFSLGNPILRAVILRTATGTFFIGFYSSLYLLFAVRELGLSAAVLGAVIATGGAANLLGALVSERLVNRFGVVRTLIGSATVLGFGALLPPLARGPVWAGAAVLMVAQGFDAAWPIYNVAEISLRQSIATDHLLGRVNSAVQLTFRGVLPVGALVGGYVAEVIGMRLTMLAGGMGFLLSTLWLVGTSSIQEKQPAALGEGS
jgi:predicted MFS family arabinose efflux permease